MMAMPIRAPRNPLNRMLLMARLGIRKVKRRDGTYFIAISF